MTTAPLRTGGLRHVNLLVADVARSVAFYRSALGLERRGEKHGITFLTTPGTDDSLALQQAGGDLDRLSGRTRTPGDGGGSTTSASWCGTRTRSTASSPPSRRTGDGLDAARPADGRRHHVRRRPGRLRHRARRVGPEPCVRARRRRGRRRPR